MPVLIKKYKIKENLVYMNVKWIREGFKKKEEIFITLGLDPPPLESDKKISIFFGY